MDEETPSGDAASHWDGGGVTVTSAAAAAAHVLASSAALSRRSSSQPTATIHCTKSEPLSGEDLAMFSGTTTHHSRAALTAHANSVPPVRMSRLHDMAAMPNVRSCDGLLSDDAGSASSFETHTSSRHQISTDSSLSSTSAGSRDTGVTLPLNSQLMPPKSVIQDDIRMKLGRFELVKKKGRSEVWNLFGQVLDTTTGARLPYVACYACKVLYTDTGGGTGNMTRHRCPLGTSYKDSSIGSSTDTNTDLPSQPSFETTVSASGQLSPETGSSYQRESPAPPQSHTSLTAQSSFESSPPFSDFDRRLFCASAVRCCATDLLPPVVFQGDGLRAVIETAISIGRRCRLADRQSLATLIPDTSTLQQLIGSSSKTVLSELKVEVAFTARTTGVSLSVESVAGDDRLTVISANYVGSDWRLKRRIISVEMRDQLRAGVERVLKDCASGALRVTVVSEEPLPIIEPARMSVCICATLNSIVHSIFTHAIDENRNVADVIASCQKIASTLEKMGLERWAEALGEQRAGLIDYLFYVYELLKFVRECVQHSSVAQYPDLIALVRPVDWSFVDDIRKYLEPFHVMAAIFSQKAVINYHMVLPEWFALIHEFSGEDEESSASADSSSKWLWNVRKATEEKLRAVTNTTIGIEHRMATVLNPRLKHLPVICTDLQRMETYTKIRSMIGPWESRTATVKTDDQLSSETMEGEPPRKRISFLSSLEDRAMIDDELECYLRSQFPAIQTKDVLQFWSTLGQTQFPNLAHLARYLLSIPAACCQHRSQSNVGLPPESLSSLLVLRSSDVLQFWSTLGQTQFPNLAHLARYLLSIPAACCQHRSQSNVGLPPESLSSLLVLRSSYAHATHLPDASSFSISSVLSAKSTVTKVDA
ncbi:hypothetical protein Tcan_07977 [Toxocara canis]|uniref:BED-type domain-containing protein n=1 Tax=Toxocara canis TaxID=6265 RepID=A0A0B2V926_TOXCA|nr:hypothetical protein Tcan_07977 [Toxocara canis]